MDRCLLRNQRNQAQSRRYPKTFSLAPLLVLTIRQMVSALSIFGGDRLRSRSFPRHIPQNPPTQLGLARYLRLKKQEEDFLTDGR